MKQLFFLIVILIGSLMISCKSIMMAAYGIKKPRALSVSKMTDLAAELKISNEELFFIDKNYFLNLEKRDTIKKSIAQKKCSEMISKYEQPLQLLYFNRSGNLVSFHNNCYAGGFPKLKWNRENQFDKFIPRSTIPITDTALNLSFILNYIKPVSGYNQPTLGEYTVIVFWAGFMKKQSKELIKVAQKNLLLDKNKTSRIFFIITDNCFTDEEYKNQINRIN